MKGHVGDGARSGDLRVPDTGYDSRCHDMSFVSITFDKCRYRLPKFDAAVGGVGVLPLIRAVVFVTQT